MVMSDLLPSQDSGEALRPGVQASSRPAVASHQGYLRPCLQTPIKSEKQRKAGYKDKPNVLFPPATVFMLIRYSGSLQNGQQCQHLSHCWQNTRHRERAHFGPGWEVRSTAAGKEQSRERGQPEVGLRKAPWPMEWCSPHLAVLSGSTLTDVCRGVFPW